MVDVPEPLGKLLEDDDPAVRDALLVNPALPEALLTSLGQSPDRFVRARVAANPSTPADLLSDLADDRSLRVREGVARNAAAPGGVLERLARDQLSSVRLTVLGNPSVTPEALRILSGDSKDEIRIEVAKHPRTDSETLRALAQTPDDIAIHVIGNPMTPREVLERLAGDPSPDLQAAARRQLETPRTALFQDSTDREHRTEEDDSSGISGDTETLTRLAQSSRAANRVLAAQHENTPLSLLSDLASDPDASVREAVASNTAAIAHWASRRRSNEESIGASSGEAASTPTARDDHQEIWRIPLEGIEEGQPWMWISPTGRWLAIRVCLEQSAEVLLVDVGGARVDAGFPLSGSYSDEYPIDINWTSDESVMSILECSFELDSGVDRVPVRLYSTITGEAVFQSDVIAPDSIEWGWLHPTGIRFDRAGLRFVVDFHGVNDPPRHFPASLTMFDIKDGTLLDDFTWAPPGAEVVMNASMTKSFVVIDRQYMSDEGSSRFALWIHDIDSSTYQSVDLGPKPVINDPWLSEDERAVYVEVSEPAEILEISVEDARVVRRFDSVGFEPPALESWSRSGRRSAADSVTSPEGNYVYAFDDASQSVVATRLATSQEESAGVTSPSKTPGRGQSSRGIIPLELPHD